MGSTLNLKKVCEYCNTKFTAMKSTTRFCSNRCSSRAYKHNVKQLKTQLAESKSIQRVETASPALSVIQLKQFLDINETSILLKCSASTLRKLISKGVIKTVNIGRKHIIRRTDIEILFDNSTKN